MTKCKKDIEKLQEELQVTRKERDHFKTMEELMNANELVEVQYSAQQQSVSEDAFNLSSHHIGVFFCILFTFTS